MGQGSSCQASESILFVSLLALIFIAAIIYGTVEPWWKAAFVCFVFVLWILGTIEDLLSPTRRMLDQQLLLPLFALVAFALLQSVPLGARSHPAIPHQIWNAISADPYQTQFFAAQLLAITFSGALLSRYVSTDRRVAALVGVIIAVAIASAIFGIVRQTNQLGTGFGLPLLSPGRGYGQFINPNHFALLMEMTLGLILGIILGGKTKREGCWSTARALVLVCERSRPGKTRRRTAGDDHADCRRRFALHNRRSASKTSESRPKTLALARSYQQEFFCLSVSLRG